MSPSPKVDPGRSAILVIDFVNDFVFPGGVIAEAGGVDYQARAQAIIPTLEKLLDAARETGASCAIAQKPWDGDCRSENPRQGVHRGSHDVAINSGGFLRC